MACSPAAFARSTRFSRLQACLAAAGAVPVAFPREVQFERPDVGVLPKRDFGISILCATRPLIELVLRRRADALANIRLRPACRVIGIVPMAGGAGASGVQFVNGSERSETLDTDLVVDASGRGAPTLTLLDAFCWDRPQITEIGVDIAYATAVVEIPHDAPTEWKAVLTLPDPPHVALHSVLVPTEDGRWIIAIADHSATAWIETWDSFLEASRSLITPTVYNALRYAQPPEGIRHYRFPVSTWKHFERLPRLPRGVLPVADALCRFNPIHGQGMSSAAKQARLLDDVLIGRLMSRIPSRRCNRALCQRWPRCSRRPGPCRRAPISLSRRRVANGPPISRKRESSKLPFSAPPWPIRSSIER
jgi:2-polyprenyl-6-methoxyphenol hydroxylase-like FAD-dependent oxidoreductase